MIRAGVVRGGVLAMALVLSACSPQRLLVRGVADQLASQAQSPEDDSLLARDAAAFYLKLSESVLMQDPGHLPLAAAVSGGFTQYAYAFVAFEAEKQESRDVRSAQVLQARAERLYARAHRHAMQALETRNPGFAHQLRVARPLGDGSAEGLPRLPREWVPVAYWAAASWGARISLSKDHPDVVADLPQVVALAHLAWRSDPDHAQGALASLMGTLEAARPGGSQAAARAYFERALQASGGRSAGPYLAMAEALAAPSGDRPAYEAWLRQALAVTGGSPGVAEGLLRERAQWLLETVDDRF